MNREFGYGGMSKVAVFVLASWLFVLAVCVVDMAEHGIKIHPSNVAGQPYLSGLSEHGDHFLDDDQCCKIMDDGSTVPSRTMNASPFVILFFVLWTAALVLQSPSFAGSEKSPFDSPPPGRSRSALTANSLWPNAPPADQHR